MDLIDELLEIAGCSPLMEMAYPVNFSLEGFASIPSFKGRIAYCEQRLERLGSGTSRIAYKVDDEKCLKIAKKSKKGLLKISTKRIQSLTAMTSAQQFSTMMKTVCG